MYMLVEQHLYQPVGVFPVACAAVTRLIIDGVLHEFAPIRHVHEDATELVLNIKGIRLCSYTERPEKNHSGPCSRRRASR